MFFRWVWFETEAALGTIHKCVFRLGFPVAKGDRTGKVMRFWTSRKTIFLLFTFLFFSSFSSSSSFFCFLLLFFFFSFFSFFSVSFFSFACFQARFLPSSSQVVKKIWPSSNQVLENFPQRASQVVAKFQQICPKWVVLGHKLEAAGARMCKTALQNSTQIYHEPNLVWNAVCVKFVLNFGVHFGLRVVTMGWTW